MYLMCTPEYNTADDGQTDVKDPWDLLLVHSARSSMAASLLLASFLLWLWLITISTLRRIPPPPLPQALPSPFQSYISHWFFKKLRLSPSSFLKYLCVFCGVFPPYAIYILVSVSLALFSVVGNFWVVTVYIKNTLLIYAKLVFWNDEIYEGWKTLYVREISAYSLNVMFLKRNINVWRKTWTWLTRLCYVNPDKNFSRKCLIKAHVYALKL